MGEFLGVNKIPGEARRGWRRSETEGQEVEKEKLEDKAKKGHRRKSECDSRDLACYQRAD